MEKEDIEMRLISGLPIYVDEYVKSIEPLTLKEVSELGYSKYNFALNFLSRDPFELIEINEDNKQIKEIKGMHILLLAGDVLTDHFVDSLKVFFKTDHITPVKEEGVVIIGKIKEEEVESGELSNPILTADSFDNFREVVMVQNGAKSLDEASSNLNPKDDVAKSIMEKLNKNKEDVNKYKSKDNGDDENTNLVDVISSVSCKSNSINKLNIFDLTVYQLYDDYKRLVAIESYQVGIDSMLQGAKQDNLKHWSSKLK